MTAHHAIENARTEDGLQFRCTQLASTGPPPPRVFDLGLSHQGTKRLCDFPFKGMESSAYCSFAGTQILQVCGLVGVITPRSAYISAANRERRRCF
jgi:hypothetical protein